MRPARDVATAIGVFMDAWAACEKYGAGEPDVGFGNALMAGMGIATIGFPPLGFITVPGGVFKTGSELYLSYTVYRSQEDSCKRMRAYFEKLLRMYLNREEPFLEAFGVLTKFNPNPNPK